MVGMDCGGLLLVGARERGLTCLEFLGYASFPTEGKFEELLRQETRWLWKREFPYGFDGTEVRPGDLISFDYGNGEGTRHVAIVTKWDGRRYRILDATPNHGVCEHGLSAPFVTAKTVLQGWEILGLGES